MGSSGGGSYQPPSQAQPSGMITGFGSATPWAPSYNNVLPSSGWATVEGVEGAMNSNAARAAAAPPPAAAAAPAFDQAALRQMLAQIMNPPNTPQQQQALRIGMMPGARGSYAGGGGGASYTGSSAMRR